MPRCDQCGELCLDPDEIIEWDGLTFCGPWCYDDYADENDLED